MVKHRTATRLILILFVLSPLQGQSTTELERRIAELEDKMRLIRREQQEGKLVAMTGFFDTP